MANRRNTARIKRLAQQVKPCNQAFITKCFVDATEFKPLASSSPKKYGYGYLILDFNLQSPDILMCRTNIFPEEVSHSISSRSSSSSSYTHLCIYV